jgi:predicted RNA-binding protein associated with RNAse of E/G family
MLQRPGDAYAVWVFWGGRDRAFRGWYVNLQDPFRRREDGYDTQDHELDVWLPAEGGWELKDDDLLDVRVREGRFAPEQAVAFRQEARHVIELVRSGRRWWDESWAAWTPPAGWDVPERRR